mmetsp:Transcript_29618/g.91480  ORF Transcript_29618/g.91480 Transcript_29618/m.91480 type:complete len:301 (-) Transcript_29618:1669-2571(-)
MPKCVSFRPLGEGRQRMNELRLLRGCMRPGSRGRASWVRPLKGSARREAEILHLGNNRLARLFARRCLHGALQTAFVRNVVEDVARRHGLVALLLAAEHEVDPAVQAGSNRFAFQGRTLQHTELLRRRGPLGQLDRVEIHPVATRAECDPIDVGVQLGQRVHLRDELLRVAAAGPRRARPRLRDGVKQAVGDVEATSLVPRRLRGEGVEAHQEVHHHGARAVVRPMVKRRRLVVEPFGVPHRDFLRALRVRRADGLREVADLLGLRGVSGVVGCTRQRPGQHGVLRQVTWCSRPSAVHHG